MRVNIGSMGNFSAVYHTLKNLKWGKLQKLNQTLIELQNWNKFVEKVVGIRF
jgi:hypothetical protein